jgi:hypothetical protein
VAQEEDDDGLGLEDSTSEARQYFDGVLRQVPHHLESMLGRAKCCELDKDFNSAMEGLNQVGAGQQIPPYQQHHTFPLFRYPFPCHSSFNHKYQMK